MSDAVVKADWLEGKLGDPAVQVIDARTYLHPDGSWNGDPIRTLYAQGHIPGASYVDLANEVNDSSDLAFTRPSSADFQKAVGELGIDPRRHVVVYDQGAEDTVPFVTNPTTVTAIRLTWQRFRAARGLPTFGRIGNGGPAPSKWATRLWWQLKSQGFDRVSVLEEGFLGWRSAGHPVAEGVETAEPVTVDTTPLDGWFVDTPEVFAATTSADVTLLDSRERDRYVAERKMSYRPGHIPTARHLALGETLAPGSAALKPLAELRATFATRLPEDGRVITYCGGGVSASWNAFALYVSGRRDIAVYDGSMGEWGRTNHPLIIGDETAG